jgi:hypothetical protein
MDANVVLVILAVVLSAVVVWQCVKFSKMEE